MKSHLLVVHCQVDNAHSFCSRLQALSTADKTRRGDSLPFKPFSMGLPSARGNDQKRSAMVYKDSSVADMKVQQLRDALTELSSTAYLSLPKRDSAKLTRHALIRMLCEHLQQSNTISSEFDDSSPSFSQAVAQDPILSSLRPETVLKVSFEGISSQSEPSQSQSQRAGQRNELASASDSASDSMGCVTSASVQSSLSKQQAAAASGGRKPPLAPSVFTPAVRSGGELLLEKKVSPPFLPAHALYSILSPTSRSLPNHHYYRLSSPRRTETQSPCRHASKTAG